MRMLIRIAVAGAFATMLTELVKVGSQQEGNISYNISNSLVVITIRIVAITMAVQHC